jgi:hypothetical protein
MFKVNKRMRDVDKKLYLLTERIFHLENSPYVFSKWFVRFSSTRGEETQNDINHIQILTKAIRGT